MSKDATAIRIKEADGIRGLACLIVLLVHAIALTFPSSYPYFYGAGKIGVWLFFSLSSFLLTYQFLMRGFSTTTLIDYFLGRTIRIYPLFLFSVLLYYFFGTADINTARDVIDAITFRNAYAHLWTIPVEFKFYFILPALAFIGQLIYSRLGLKALLMTTLLLTFIHQIYAPYWLLPSNSIETFQYLPAFLFGMSGAFIKVYNTDSWFTKRATFLGISILIGIFVSTPFMRYFLLGLPPTGYLLNKYLFFSLAWTAFIISQSNSSGFLSSVLENRVLTMIGTYSYSIYLIHWLILNKLIAYYPESISTVFITLLCSVMAGFLMYTFIEKPLLSTRKILRTAYSLRQPSEA